MSEFHNPALVIETGKVPSGKVVWRSPSNIALIKYWGKYDIQMPCNPSVSFTLDAAHTETTLEYGPKMTEKKGVCIDFMFDGVTNQAFSERIERFLESLLPVFPFLSQVELTLFSSNSFPHSAGIASSASAMSALALCLCTMEDEIFGTLGDDERFDRKASYVARLGSGSACRSIYPEAALWGEIAESSQSSQEYAIGWGRHIHDEFKTFHDDILIVSRAQKSISSSVGHRLMESNPYSETRYITVQQRLKRLLMALKRGDIPVFGEIVEQEAMALHGLMMLSEPCYILMQPGTLAIIDEVRRYREATKTPLYFTLDAGPNIHLLYPDAYQAKVSEFIRHSLLRHCIDQSYIPDQVGQGPLQL
jgi:diphosphomevalonate decarboxylase